MHNFDSNVFHRYVLPESILLHIVEELPAEKQGILDCCGPDRVPPLVEEYVEILHELILKARNQPLDEVEGHIMNSFCFLVLDFLCF